MGEERPVPQGPAASQQLVGENFLTLIGGEMGGQDCGLGGFCLFSDTP